MTDAVVSLPELVDGAGNINVHGREGFTLLIEHENAEGVSVDISAEVLYFEVAGKLRIAATAGDTVYERRIVVTVADVETLPLKSPLSYCIRAETLTPPAVWASGVIKSYGYEGQPT